MIVAVAQELRTAGTGLLLLLANEFNELPYLLALLFCLPVASRLLLKNIVNHPLNTCLSKAHIMIKDSLVDLSLRDDTLVDSWTRTYVLANVLNRERYRCVPALLIEDRTEHFREMGVHSGVVIKSGAFQTLFQVYRLTEDALGLLVREGGDHRGGADKVVVTQSKVVGLNDHAAAFVRLRRE